MKIIKEPSSLNNQHLKNYVGELEQRIEEVEENIDQMGPMEGLVYNSLLLDYKKVLKNALNDAEEELKTRGVDLKRFFGMGI